VDTSFWISDEGIRLRTRMLAQFIVVRTQNRTLKKYGKEAGVKSLTFRTMPDACDLCLPYDGRVYRLNQYIKYIPVHPWCRCGYEPNFGPEWLGDFVPTVIQMRVCENG